VLHRIQLLGVLPCDTDPEISCSVPVGFIVPLPDPLIGALLQVARRVCPTQGMWCPGRPKGRLGHAGCNTLETSARARVVYRYLHLLPVPVVAWPPAGRLASSLGCSMGSV
jgi:hypothetical protein